jgi:hypothetical protein
VRAIVLLLLLAGCSAEWHLTQAVRKGGEVWRYKYDTVIVTKERKLTDTLVLRQVDSITVTNDKVRVKLVRRWDTIRVSATCIPDTIRITKEIPVKIQTQPKRWSPFVFQLLAACAIVLGFASLIRR